ncbi:hypothetical protein C0583_02470 [Candidatus Parcubacteria bacterium]|nr:MAG: hypothetical protein C0583_02470 [Candidatus Parcubacteria bacterium]
MKEKTVKSIRTVIKLIYLAIVLVVAAWICYENIPLVVIASIVSFIAFVVCLDILVELDYSYRIEQGEVSPEITLYKQKLITSFPIVVLFCGLLLHLMYDNGVMGRLFGVFMLIPSIIILCMVLGREAEIFEKECEFERGEREK